MTRRIVPMLLLSCLSEPIGDSDVRAGVDYEGVRLIGGQGTDVGAASACEVLRACCEGDPQCIDFVDGLTEGGCQNLLDGEASECLDQGGDGGCCEPDDPCGFSDDGICDCPGQFWDFGDCEGGEGEAEAEAEAEPDCCDPDDPCGLADDGWCDCPDADWEANDCGVPVPDAGVPD